MLSVIMLNVANKPFLMSVIMLSVIMLNVANKPFLLRVIMLSVVMLNGVASTAAVANNLINC